MRLVEAATTEYREARSLIHKAWNDDGMGLRDNIRACAYFEACLSNMHRAVLSMKDYEAAMTSQSRKGQFPGEPQFRGPVSPSEFAMSDTRYITLMSASSAAPYPRTHRSHFERVGRRPLFLTNQGKL